MFAALRNAGQPGAGSMAVAAVDTALWDLHARLRGVPLYQALPAFRDHVPVYGSGGFTNYPLDRLAEQLAGWVEQGIPRVKMKTSRDPGADPRRLSAVRKAIGDEPELFVDANGALGRKEALRWAWRFHDEWGVSWFEEPVSSQDLDGLRLLRDRGPPGTDIAAGEYAFGLDDFAGLLRAGAVDCLQADVTRCGGVTGLLQVAGLSAGARVDLSAHCAPAVSAHAFCAVPRLRHLEYFHDHVRVEHLAFDGNPSPAGGALWPDPRRPGLGLDVRWSDLERYRVHGTRGDPARSTGAWKPDTP
jgi:L-alanine-DL-glutamate epimerase-like enolase superfamily enzyme